MTSPLRRAVPTILAESHAAWDAEWTAADAAARREVNQAIVRGLVADDDVDGIAFQYDYTFNQMVRRDA